MLVCLFMVVYLTLSRLSSAARAAQHHTSWQLQASKASLHTLPEKLRSTSQLLQANSPHLLGGSGLTAGWGVDVTLGQQMRNM